MGSLGRKVWGSRDIVGAACGGVDASGFRSKNLSRNGGDRGDLRRNPKKPAATLSLGTVGVLAYNPRYGEGERGSGELRGGVP
jgi:hypothetical protein